MTHSLTPGGWWAGVDNEASSPFLVCGGWMVILGRFHANGGLWVASFVWLLVNEPGACRACYTAGREEGWREGGEWRGWETTQPCGWVILSVDEYLVTVGSEVQFSSVQLVVGVQMVGGMYSEVPPCDVGRRDGLWCLEGMRRCIWTPYDILW